MNVGAVVPTGRNGIRSDERLELMTLTRKANVHGAQAA